MQMRLADAVAMLGQLLSNPLVVGLTISAGEPFLQPEATLALASQAKALGRVCLALHRLQPADTVAERLEHVDLVKLSGTAGV